MTSENMTTRIQILSQLTKPWRHQECIICATPWPVWWPTSRTLDVCELPTSSAAVIGPRSSASELLLNVCISQLKPVPEDQGKRSQFTSRRTPYTFCKARTALCSRAGVWRDYLHLFYIVCSNTISIRLYDRWSWKFGTRNVAVSRIDFIGPLAVVYFTHVEAQCQICRTLSQGMNMTHRWHT